MNTGQLEKLSSALYRLQTQLNFAEKLLSLRPDPVGKMEVDLVRKKMTEEKPRLSEKNASEFVAGCEKQLRHTASLAKRLTVHAVGHAHIDMNWTWPLDETLAVIHDTFFTVLTLMQRYPEFTFSQSQASVYRLLELYHPELLEKIKEAVKKKRWEVSSVTWVEADKNLTSGESQVRQILYARKYFQKIFGLPEEKMVLDFEPDTFGHAATVPSILAAAGVKYYYHCRGSQGPKLARWIGPDGQEVLTYFEKDSWYIKHGEKVSPESIGDFALMSLQQTGFDQVLFVYGIGDHGGGPTVRDIENILQAASWPVFPKIIFSTYHQFFRTVEPFRNKLPEIRGELNFMFTGCYSSQSEIKKAHRDGERYLKEAETSCSLIHRLTGNFPYPATILEGAWEKHLFNQFHDILPGSGTAQTREYALGQFQELAAATAAVRKKALQCLAGLINTEEAAVRSGLKQPASDLALGGGAGFLQRERGLSAPGSDDAGSRVFVVYNPCPFSRTEVVEAILWDMPARYPVVVKDNQGKTVLSQVLKDDGHYWGHNYQRVLFLAEQVPASGYRTYIIGESPEAQPCLRQRYDYRLEQPMNFILENDRLLVQLDNSSGAIKRLFLKESNLELVSPEKPLALFRLIEERFPLGAGMTAWLVGSYSRIENLEGVCFSADSLCNGPLRRAITWNAKIRHSRLTVTLSLDRNSADLSLKGHCLWREWGEKDRFVPQLNLQFPLRIKSPVRHYEIPFGWVMRNEEEMDLPALRWADINGLIPGTRQKAGLTVYTEAKHGFRSGEDFLALTLLRSSHDPDPVPEIGEHSFRIILSPYTGPFHPERCFQKAETADFPMTVFQTDAHAGLLPSEGSFLEIAENNVVLASLKKPEDGSGLVLRFYEVAGKKTNLHLKLHRKIFPSGVAVTETDTCEHKKGKTVRFSGPEIRWEIPSRGLLTLLLEPSG